MTPPAVSSSQTVNRARSSLLERLFRRVVEREAIRKAFLIYLDPKVREELCYHLPSCPHLESISRRSDLVVTRATQVADLARGAAVARLRAGQAQEGGDGLRLPVEARTYKLGGSYMTVKLSEGKVEARPKAFDCLQEDAIISPEAMVVVSQQPLSQSPRVDVL